MISLSSSSGPGESRKHNLISLLGHLGFKLLDYVKIGTAALSMQKKFPHFVLMPQNRRLLIKLK